MKTIGCEIVKTVEGDLTWAANVVPGTPAHTSGPPDSWSDGDGGEINNARLVLTQTEQDALWAIKIDPAKVPEILAIIFPGSNPTDEEWFEDAGRSAHAD